MGTYFNGADIENTTFKDITAPEGVFFDGATLFNVVWNGVSLTADAIKKNALGDCCSFCKTMVGERYGRNAVEVDTNCDKPKETARSN
jgi:hypothetical protein